VEATKFTEVGFHGRDVDQIIRDLVDNAISLQRQKVCSSFGYQGQQGCLFLRFKDNMFWRLAVLFNTLRIFLCPIVLIQVRAKLVKEVEKLVEARLLDIFISRQRPPMEVSPIETWPPVQRAGPVNPAPVEVSVAVNTGCTAVLETQNRVQI
jgi:hypothetical protein